MKKMLKGKIIIENYGNRNVYQIVDVHFDKNPTTEIDKQSDKSVTSVQYYSEKYGISINDLKQPILQVNQINEKQLISVKK